MVPPLPIGGACHIAGFVVTVSDHNMTENAKQGEIGGLIALRLPGGAVGLGERLDARIGNKDCP